MANNQLIESSQQKNEYFRQNTFATRFYAIFEQKPHF